MAVGMKFIGKFMSILPFVVLAVSLAQVVGFVLLHEPYLAGAWMMTSMMSSLAIIYTQRWRDAEDRVSAERLVSKHLTDVITRHIEKEGDSNEVSK